MNRKPWPILVGIVLVLLLAAAALWWRPRPAASPLLVSPSPSPPVYRLPSILSAYDTLTAANVAPAATIRWVNEH